MAIVMLESKANGARDDADIFVKRDKMTSFDLTSSHPAFLFSIAGAAIPMSVVSFSAYEWISHLYTVKLTVSTSAPMEPLDVATRKEALLTIVNNEGGAEETRYFHGIISEIVLLGVSQRRYTYEVELVPSLWRLTLRKNCRIFQEMNAQDIITRLLQEGGITSDRYHIGLMKKERKRGFCVQYRESDFDFISRLMEEEGLFYFFQHFEDKHVMIIGDYKGIHPHISGSSSIPFNAGGMSSDEVSISSFSCLRRIGSGAFVHRNFNFKRPSLDLTSRESCENNDQFEVYDYPALHTTTEIGKRLATVRMEEIVAQQSQGNGQTSCCRLVPGHTFTLTDHDCGGVNIEYLVLSVIQTGMQPQSLEEAANGGFSYDVDFSVMDASVPFRPRQTVNKPVIPGLQSAIVVGPPGEELYTDEYARIKVRFHWDRETTGYERSSCWLRINQAWSGSTWGMIAIPRVGDEVLVAFLEGDPDRPIMVGSVNNAQSPALYPLPQSRTRTGIRTQSTPNGTLENFHELRFEDSKGSEEIYLQSERDWNILVKNDKGEVVGNDETLLVQNDRKKTVRMNQTESIGLNNTVEIGADQYERTGANKNESVGGNCAESVGAVKELTIGGLYQVSVGGAMNETVAGAKTEEVGMAKGVLVGADLAEQVLGSRLLKVGSHFQIEAGESFEVKCGSSVLRMNSDGSVFINGARLELGATGVVKVGGADIQLN
jgi:type VI secretion system secreted protein VgrG